MAAETFACPECQASLRYSPNLKPGDEVQCPKCRTQFPVPDPATLPAGPTEEYTDKPGASRPRFSAPPDEDISATRRPAGYGGRAGDGLDEDHPDRPLTGEYAIDINQWFSAAGQHYGAFFGPAIGFIFVVAILFYIPYIVIAVAAELIGSQVAPHDPGLQFVVAQMVVQPGMLFLMSVVIIPLSSGFTAVCLAQLQGRPWTFGTFFSGFQRFGAMAGVGLASQLLGLVVSLPLLAGMFFFLQSKSLQPLLIGLAFTLIGLLVVVIPIQIRLFLFAPAIIFDRNLGAMDAVKANWQLTRGHFWGLLGICIVLCLIYLGGAAACGIGALFALPYIMLILNAGYLLITGAREPEDFVARYND